MLHQTPHLKAGEGVKSLFSPGSITGTETLDGCIVGGKLNGEVEPTSGDESPLFINNGDSSPLVKLSFPRDSGLLRGSAGNNFAPVCMTASTESGKTSNKAIMIRKFPHSEPVVGIPRGYRGAQGSPVKFPNAAVTAAKANRKYAASAATRRLTFTQVLNLEALLESAVLSCGVIFQI